MNHAVEKIARTLLYEGVTLYPYRQSALKNHQRFHFGSLFPASYCQARQAGEAATQQLECLFEWSPVGTIDLVVRFLQAGTPEVCERECCLEADIQELVATRARQTFAFDGLLCELEWQARQLSPTCGRLTLTIRNGSQWSSDDTDLGGAESAFAMLSTHAILQLKNSNWISLLEPPPHAQHWAQQCVNLGVWPVLAGTPPERDTLLVAPIILYDYPQVAPESAGDFFDGTEIDELLTLRVLTLTEAEKNEMRAGSERARQILERVESLPLEHLLRLHGAWRAIKNEGESCGQK